MIGVGFGVSLALALITESRSSLGSPGGWNLALSRIAGMSGTYLILVMLLLISRVSFLERALGQDRLVRWHRKIAPWAIGLISVHVILVTFGYAQMQGSGIVSQIWTFIEHYRDLLAAIVAFGLLLAASIASLGMFRRRMKYETWWAVHLYFYLAVVLAFAHQIMTGVMFIGHPLAKGAWVAMSALAAGTVIVFRMGLPIIRNLRHRLRVAAVDEIAPGVFAVVCAGRGLETLPVSGGQFFQWRFLARDLWWHSHPYSLSALPRPPYLRLTVKARGDQSRAISSLKPGTRVWVEGPYGTFTSHRRTGDHVTLVGAGVGVTPLRAILEDLPRHVRATVVVRASNSEAIVHRDELKALAERRGGSLVELTGSRHSVRMDSTTLARLVPDIATSDVFICGPGGFSEEVAISARRLGVDPERIHQEEFSF